MKPTINYLNKAYSWLYGLSLIMLITSCTKTEYEQLKRPYNHIERFALGGYGGLDSISAVIDQDVIKVYWSGDSELPASIKPNIKVSAGATIIPASGEEVSFSANTTYTVTAEDGTERKYVLKPIAHKAIPVLAGFVNEVQWNYSGPDWQWGNGKKLKINGQYFLTNNEVSEIRVYAQRLLDGFEFDLPLNTDETTTTQVTVTLPKLTAELDSGMHRIWVQVGDFPSNSLDVWIATPKISDVVKSVALQEAGQTIYLGDNLHYTFEVDETKMEPELFEKYFNSENYLYYQVRASFLDNYLYSKYATDLYTGGERRAIINGNRFVVPVTADIWGGFLGVHEMTNGTIHLNSELFLYGISFFFQGKAYPDNSAGQAIRSLSSILALSSSELNTSYKNRFAKR